MKTPTLVAGSINRPLGTYSRMGLLKAVTFDLLSGASKSRLDLEPALSLMYEGSQAMAKSLRAIAPAFIQFRIHQSWAMMITLRPGGRELPIYGFAAMSPEELESYVEAVKDKLPLV